MPIYTEPPPPQAKNSDADRIEWETPKPLPPLETPPEPFDPDALPHNFRPWVEDVAKRMQCPIEYPAAAAMTIAGALLGRGLAIRPKQKDDWLEFANIWMMAVGRPSAMKSPPLAEMLRPVNAIEAAAKIAWESLDAEFKKDFAAFETLDAAHKTNERQRATAAVKKGETYQANEGPEAPQPPPRPRIITNDCTVEKLVELIRDNPRGLLLERDELAAWLAALSKPGREGDRQFFLESAAGKKGLTVDRIGRGTIDAPPVCLSIMGTIQPDVLAGLIEGKALDDGLSQRFGMTVYPEMPESFDLVDAYPDSRARTLYADTLELLHATNKKGGPQVGEQQDEEIRFLRFAPDAGEAFRAWLTDLMRRTRSADMPQRLESHLSKYRKLAPALALICEMVDNTNAQTVSLEAWNRAALWVKILESHARKIYAPAIQPEVDAAHRIKEKIESGQLGESFTTRDVYRPGWTGLQSHATARAGCEVLAAAGWISEVPTDSGPGRPSAQWKINPILTQK